MAVTGIRLSTLKIGENFPSPYGKPQVRTTGKKGLNMSKLMCLRTKSIQNSYQAFASLKAINIRQ
jgi:hypothetical protein